MDYNEILKDISKGQAKPIYFLTGEEPYFIDSIMDEAEQSLVPLEQRDFNLQVVYGKDTPIKLILESCRQFPFMGDRKLILVKEAQDIKDWEVMDSYFKTPVPTTTLIIAYKNKKPDGRSAWVKTVKEKTVYFESKAIYDNHLPSFITSQASRYQLKLEPEAATLMAEYIGNDLSQIDNELQKLKVNIKPNEKITIDIITDQIGISKEYNIYELTKVISSRDKRKMYLIARNMAIYIKNNPLIPTIVTLFNHFVKIWLTKTNIQKSDAELMALLKIPFATFVKEYREAAKNYNNESILRAIHILKEYDLKSKGVDVHNVNPEDLFIEMMLKISQI